jgi:hypothetical protein
MSLAGLFFPQAKALGIDAENGISPLLLDKITHIGVILPSFPQAAQATQKLLDLDLNTKRVERATERIGLECVEKRDADLADYKALKLTTREDGPADVIIPECGAVMADGGRFQRSETNPDSQNHWFEYKAGICLTLEGEASETDPLPNVPQFLLDEAYVKQLTIEVGQKSADSAATVTSDRDPVPQVDLDSLQNLDGLERALAEAIGKASTEPVAESRNSARDEPLSPKVISREVVATQQNCHALGLLLAAQAWALGLFKSSRKAFLGDGSSWIWGIWEKHFKPAEFVPILDLIHAVTYVYAAATAAQTSKRGSEVYQCWIKWVWEGNVAQVIEELGERQAELGLPAEGESQTSPRSIVSQALGYLRNQQSRMNYPEYRQQGLPITSAHMESTVKEINRRIKGSEKFWNAENSEAILQLKANTLCDSQPMVEFWKNRHETRTGFRNNVGKRRAHTLTS